MYAVVEVRFTECLVIILFKKNEINLNKQKM